MSRHIYIHTCMYINIYVSMCAYIYMCIYAYVYMYIRLVFCSCKSSISRGQLKHNYTEKKQTPRSKWTECGAVVASSQDYKNGKITLKPGEHYIVVEPPMDANFFAFPREPCSVYQTFRHSWVSVWDVQTMRKCGEEKRI